MIITLARVKRVLATYGFLGTLTLIKRRFIDACIDGWFDWQYGVETEKRMGLELLAISSDNKSSGHDYVPTGRRRFRALLRAVQLPCHSLGFVDYGCGKGRVLMEAADAGFKRVVGVDFSHELCVAARMNLAIFSERRRNLADIEIVEADAALYDPPADTGVFYFYNPFDELVLRKVVERIRESLRRYPREAWLIYHWPKHREVIEEFPEFALEHDITAAEVKLKVKFLVYRYICDRG